MAFTDTYSYDATDQIELVKYNFNPANGGTQDRVVNYNYDAAGNRATMNDNGATTNYGTANYLNQYATESLGLTYDSNSNLKGQPGWNYTYDAQNRLVSASGNGVAMTFAYDGRNRCVKRTLGSTPTYLYYDGWNLMKSTTVPAHCRHGTFMGRRWTNCWRELQAQEQIFTTTTRSAVPLR